MCRRFDNALRLVAGVFFLLVVPANVRAQLTETNRVTLTHAAQVRALTLEEASQHPVVHLQGIAVTQGDWMVLQDKTAGIYLLSSNVLRKFQIGDVLSVEGVVDPGKFAPVVLVSNVLKLSSGAVPMATTVTFPQLQTGCFDAQLVEVTGVVRRSEISPEDDHLWVLSLALDGGELTVALAVSRGRSLVVDSEVRLRGVCFYQFNKSRQAVKPVLWMTDNAPVSVLSQAPADPFNVKERPISSLFQFSAEDLFSHRVCVSGVVTHSVKGEGFWIHNVGEGLRVRSLQNQALTVGDQVKVLGFLSRGEYSPVLEDAVFRRQGRSENPIPLRLTDMQQALDHDQDLVQMEARILEEWRVQDGCRFTLETDAGHFAAFLKLGANQGLPRDWIPGSRVEIAGICLVAASAKGAAFTGVVDPGSFQILLRSPADITILQPPPWWTPEHIAWVLGIGFGAVLLVLAAVFLAARHRLRQQAVARMKSEAEFSAVLNERNRMARELHDTLAQGLGAISLQLEVAKRQLPADSTAQQPLAEAGTQTRASLGEVRDAIWNMRSQVLETGDLASALNGVLHALTDRTHLQSELKVVGEPKRFAPVVENNLLRIGQEAIANAVKHAQAKRIEVVLKFEKRQFELCVRDDGRGFDPSHPPASEGGFGLVGMRERVAELHGELNVSSAPEKGCVVKLTMPLSTP